MESAKEHTFERVSVAHDYEILTEALRHGRGEIRHEELKETLSVQETTGAILRRGSEIATRQRKEKLVPVIQTAQGKPTPGTIKPPSDEIRLRIEAVKQRKAQPEPDIKQFEYDPDQPLHLI